MKMTFLTYSTHQTNGQIEIEMKKKTSGKYCFQLFFPNNKNLFKRWNKNRKAIPMSFQHKQKFLKKNE